MEDFKAGWDLLKIYFENNIEYWYLVNFIIGTCVASCVGLIVARWPKKLSHLDKKSLVSYWEDQGFDPNDATYLRLKEEIKTKPDGFSYPASRCDSCGNKLKSYHNIPILGWLLLKGRCGFCDNKIPAIVVLMEIFGGGLAVLISWFIGDVSLYVFMWIAIAAFISSVTLLDWETLELPTYDLTKFVVLILILTYVLPKESLLLSTEDALLGSIVGFSILLILNKLIYGYGLLLNWISKLSGREGREPMYGFGEGDYYLFAALGVLLGWEKIMVTAFLSIFVGAAIGISLITYNKITKKEKAEENIIDLSENKIANIDGKMATPFGPSISLAALLTLVIYKLNLIQSYLPNFLN